jgi:aspartyl-tRNA(Asn)/glutamyl-tRNA(Gln) amidotransferase subunit B
MEKGSLRCDANISLRDKGETQLGVKVELKNMNTFKGVRQALEYEAKRQRAALMGGVKISQETRMWDAELSRTEVMRTKEEAHVYRYFPDPDLLDFFIDEESIEKEKSFIKELPLAKRRRFLNAYGLSENDVGILISNKELSDFFEESCKAFSEPKKNSNRLLGPFLEQLNLLGGSFEAMKISPFSFAKLIRYFSEERLNNLATKKILSLAIASGEDIDKIIEKEGFAQIISAAELAGFIQEAIGQNPKAVKEYLEGKEQAIMFLVGNVMKKTKGKANPKLVRQLLEKELKK